MGGTAVARRVDSSGHVSLRGYVGAGVDEDFVLLPQTLPRISQEMLCDECVFVIKGTDSSCLHISQIAQEKSG